ncbi:endonuclease [Rahnella sikkimica]|uniref:phospholipase D n=2 Tax=Rahnella sikkimica TaxID=1805933 RepID=A0A2L1UWP1_9GAMM|nr:endonuclease [Rahnella sikkimica]
MKCLITSVLIAGSVQARTVQVGFSPEGSARALVLDLINHAHKSLKMMAYEFTAHDIVDALDSAAGRGVSVQVIVDNRQNMHNAKALHNIADASAHGVQIRVDKHFHIQHDKVIIADSDAVETGSFNDSETAEKTNSENVVVLRGIPDITKQYQQHFVSRWTLSENVK